MLRVFGHDRLEKVVRNFSAERLLPEYSDSLITVTLVEFTTTVDKQKIDFKSDRIARNIEGTTQSAENRQLLEITRYFTASQRPLV